MREIHARRMRYLNDPAFVLETELKTEKIKKEIICDLETIARELAIGTPVVLGLSHDGKVILIDPEMWENEPAAKLRVVYRDGTFCLK